MKAAPDNHPIEDPGFTATFVRRPILALVVNALIIVAGLAAYFGIEVRELPQVDQPVITVRTDFAGASPETVDRELTEIIEGAVARVSGLKSVSSQSTFGSSRVTLEFTPSTDVDIASSDVRDAVGRVSNNLPEDAEEPRIIKADSDSQPIMRMAMTSTTLSPEDLTLLAENEIVDRIAAVEGVADVETYGTQEKVFRIDVDQAKLASRGLTVASLSNTLATMAFDVPAGSLTSPTQAIVVRATADITTPAQFENLLLQDRVRLGDVASVTLGRMDGTTSMRANGANGVGLGVIRQAQSNTLDISSGVHAAIDALQADLPEGTSIRVTSDDAVFIDGAINEVVTSLLMAVVIVVAVIYLFLRDFKATFIPAVTMPVALIGTLAAIYLTGFSINILTLLAIVLATGMVVDDAIVVLENIVRRRSEGMGPRAAAVIGTKEVFFAVVATTATLAAVFIPLSFLPGQTGRLFREFGFVLAFAVALSSLVSLTLCPMLASRMLGGDMGRHDNDWLSRLGGKLSGIYGRTLSVCLNAPLVVLAAGLVLSLGAYVIFTQITQELTPREDRSVVLLRATTPQGASLDYTREQMQQLEARLKPLIDSGEVRSMFSISGQGGAKNSGFMVLTLAKWDERERGQAAIAADVTKAVASLPTIQAFTLQPNSLGIRGGGSGLQVALVGNDYPALSEAAQNLINAMTDSGEFDNVRLNTEATQAQLTISVNRERASDLGIDITGLSTALQALLDGRSIGDVYVDGVAVPVTILSSSNPLNDPMDLENIFLKTADGRTVPMSTIASLEEKAVAPSLSRESQLRAVSLSANLQPGVTLGDALVRAEELAEPILPPGARVIPLGEAAVLQESSGGMGTTFAFALIIILLVLAAQFESFVSAVIIMTTVPLGLACAVFAMALTGSTLNIYSQIGLVMLVGIMAKNGILIVEFANQLRDRGESVREAIKNASSIRLRPVMMTMISTALGGVPLVLATGAGAEARIALGWVIVGGLGLATLVTLYITPVAYLLLAGLSKPHADEVKRLNSELRSAGRAVPAE
jgi:hydrophobic/amphiphilic exporter-1 (mainly G- bacteria), HAE1 family